MCVGISVCEYVGISVCEYVGISVCEYVGISVCNVPYVMSVCMFVWAVLSLILLLLLSCV